MQKNGDAGNTTLSEGVMLSESVALIRKKVDTKADI